MTAGERPFSDLRLRLVRLARQARDRAAQASGLIERRGERRPHQELAETAMALLTLWTTFDDSEADSVAATTRSLLAGHSAEELGYLVLHLAGLSRGLTHVLIAQSHPDVNDALQAVGRDVQERRVSG
jgi:hypothetical protein